MKKSLAILGMTYLACGGCAAFESDSPTLEQRVERQDMQLRQMQPQQADTWNQIQSMRQEIAQLKGQLAELNNAGGARELADRVRQHDMALRQVDNNMALNLPLGDPMTQGAATSGDMATANGYAPIQSGQGAPDSSAYASGNYGLPPDGANTTASLEPQAPSGSTWGQADPQPEAQVQIPQKDISLALFDAGVNSYNSRQYQAAERSFRDFLKNYPDHSQTAQAQYYLAECDFQRNEFPQAALAYDVVIKKYPKSSSAPGAYLKQGICFSKMGNKDAARARMQELISKYPKSPEAARAKAFLKTNK